MVGNDVVDLRDRDADIASYRAGFDARVFSEAERHAIGRGELGEATRWQLWAAKEASYKAAKQSDPRTIFSPRAFEVFCEKRWTEAVVPVQHASGTFVAVLEPARERVHAVAARSASEFAHVLRGVAPCSDPARASEEVRALACETVAKHLDVASERIAIHRKARVPLLYLDAQPLEMSLSLSHHGRWIAFACDVGGDVRG